MKHLFFAVDPALDDSSRKSAFAAAAQVPGLDNVQPYAPGSGNEYLENSYVAELAENADIRNVEQALGAIPGIRDYEEPFGPAP